MTPANDGGPAFPRPPFTPGQPLHDSAADAGFAATGHSGMTLRDWFAGQALAGLMAHPTAEFTAKGGAAIAYEFADAMLRAREGGAK